MDVSFDNVNSTSGLKKLDEYLFLQTYIKGDNFSEKDIYVYDEFSGRPSSDYVNVSRCCRLAIELALSYKDIFGEGQGVKVKRSTSISEEASVSPPVVDEASVSTDDDDDYVFEHCLCLDTECLLSKNKNLLTIISMHEDNIRKNPMLVHFIIQFSSIDDGIQQALQEYFEIVPKIMKVCQVARIDEFEKVEKRSQLQVQKFVHYLDSVGCHQLSILKKLDKAEIHLSTNLNLKLTSLLAWRKKIFIAFMLPSIVYLIILSIYDSKALMYFVLALSISVGVDNLIDIYANVYKLKNEREKMLINELKESTSVKITYLKNIEAVVDTTKEQISPFKLHNKKAAMAVIKKIRKVKNSVQMLQNSFADISRKAAEMKAS